MTRTRWKGWAGGGAAVLVVAIATLWYLSGRDDGARVAGTPERLAQGELIYEQHCAACHGMHLEGQPNWQRRRADGRLPAPPHDASGHTWHHADAELFGLTKEGPAALLPDYSSDMPGFAGLLTDDEIRDVLAFIKSQWPADIAARQKQITEGYQRNHERSAR